MKDYSEYKNFEEETWQKHLYDLSNLPIRDYLSKYHQSLEEETTKDWSKWQSKYIVPAFDKNRHEEMIKNFGYVSIDRHDFEKQYAFYNELKKDDRLDEDTRKFIGFMAGSHFFDKYVTSIEEWFDTYYWTRPDLTDEYLEYKLDYTINDILNLPYGLNYFKSVLLGLNHWRR